MGYPLWQRIAVQDGKILYFDIAQKRYQTALHKKYKNRFSISDNLRDILSVPAECQRGNYFCDLYYDNKSYHCVFTEYKIPERKRIRTVGMPFCKYRMDYATVQAYQKEFNDCDDIIFCGKYVDYGAFFAHNSLQSNVLFCEYGGWFSYEKPGFMTAELERLVAEKKVRLLDASGFNGADKMMFVNEFEPFDLQRTLPVDNSVIVNYNDHAGFTISPKVLWPCILLMLFVISPLFVTFERANYPFSSELSMELSLLFESLSGIIFLALSFFLASKLKLIEFSIIGKLWVCYLRFVITIGLASMLYMLFNQALVPIAGMYYTLIFEEKQPQQFRVEHIAKIRGIKPEHQLGASCLYVLQLKNEMNRQYYYLCTNSAKNNKIGDRYKMDVQESDFGYRLTNIEKLTDY